MSEYTQGACRDGAAILKDGQPLSIEQILEALREREALAAHVERFKSCRLESGRISLLRVRELLGDTPCISLAHRDDQQQRDGIINACNHVLSVGSSTHRAFFVNARYAYVSTRALREYADTLSDPLGAHQ